MAFISPKKAYTYFNSNFNIKKTSQNWWAFKCPFCGDVTHSMKMAVHFQYGYVKCWVCGYKKHIIEFIADYENVDHYQARETIHNTKPTNVNLDLLSSKNGTVVHTDVNLPHGYISILDGDTSLGDRARKYLTNRGFNLQELDRLGVGYCFHKDEIESKEDYFGYIIIPFKKNGKLVYYIGRDYIGNYLRYKNPPKAALGVGKGDLLFNEDALHIFDEVMVLEGWADALTIGREAISTQGWSLSAPQKHLLLNSSCERLVFIPDAGSDNTGESFYHKAIKLSMDFIDHKEVKVVDLNKLSNGKDVNELGKDIVMDLVHSTELLTVEEATFILLS